ncbi:hypothetical protein CORC01_05812 [Colletotrichum orchidophilum]|uniref:GPI transamidase component PIG-S n=1 Tax=Colletotrichum orchidophilum TaxID=1209926 RepID=A0A1G4BC33_9PEZI|nr:uncharacterized protein CORC01_05812 [Colletotrichum orchidophilum]OHE98916.1 hypothetical protein CORC01_05812 [Colletotrichum orchidophilum]
MSRLRKCTRATVLSILLASAHAASIPSVFGRQDTCAAEGFTSCGNGLPGNFCCETGKNCITLAGNTTVLCCPEGSSCEKIKTITCNINLQDPQAYPDAPIKTKALKGKLGTCGDDCCPFGYSCNSLTQCVLDSDQTKAPEEASTTPPEPTSTSTAAPSVIPTTLTPSTTPADNDNKDNDTFPTAIVIGSLCGLLVGVGLGVALLLFCARRRRRSPPPPNEKKRGGGSGAPRPSTSTSSFGNIISEPIPITDNATVRTDFILKTPSTTHSYSRSGSGSVKSPTAYKANGHNRLSSTATTLAHHPIGLARSDSAPRTPPSRGPGGGLGLGAGVGSGTAVPPIRGMRPNSGSRRFQPPNVPNPLAPPKPGYLQREPSSESINVFADPRTVGGSGRPGAKRNTTFTDMMEEAELGDVRRGKPYVPNTPQMPSQLGR